MTRALIASIMGNSGTETNNFSILLIEELTASPLKYCGVINLVESLESGSLVRLFSEPVHSIPDQVEMGLQATRGVDRNPFLVACELIQQNLRDHEFYFSGRDEVLWRADHRLLPIILRASKFSAIFIVRASDSNAASCGTKGSLAATILRFTAIFRPSLRLPCPDSHAASGRLRCAQPQVRAMSGY